MSLEPNDILVECDGPNDFIGRNSGHESRDYDVCPRGSMRGSHSFPADQIIPRSEWSDRLKYQKETKSRASDVRLVSQVPSSHQGDTNFCFPAGTFIRMADGSQKRIEDVRVLDDVVTAEGRTGKVIQTMVRHVTEPLLTPIMWGHSHLRATGGHPLLTRRGYVKLCDLQPGDMVAFPKYFAKKESLLQTGDYLFERNHVRQSRRVYREYSKQQQRYAYSAQIPGKTKIIVRGNVIPDVVHLTAGFGRLIGLFLAEGHTSPCAVHWTFHIREEGTLAAEVVSLLKSELDCDARIRLRSRVCQVVANGKRASMLFDALCSRGSKNKGLHPTLASGPSEFLNGVLSGWMDGDRQRGNAAVSVSRELALNMFDVANATGLIPAISLHSRGGEKKGIVRADAWRVGWAKNDPDGYRLNYRAEQDETYLWRKVCDIESQPFEGYVFNLEVEGDHSYVAEGIGVHNCWAHSVVNVVRLARVIAGLPHEGLSAASVGCRIKNFRNEGGWSGQALEFIVENGIVPTSLWPENSFKRGLLTPEATAAALDYRITEWWDFDPGDFDQLGSFLLQGGVGSGGWNWMGHAMAILDLVEVESSSFGVRVWDNYGEEHGDRGMYVLRGWKAVPDDHCGVRVATVKA